MNDKRKTKVQLIDELGEMRQRVAALEAAELDPLAPVEVDVMDARRLLASLRAFRKGDFSVRMPPDQIGLAGEIAEAFNDTVELAAGLNGELARIGMVVGKEGRISQRARLRQAIGGWGDCVDSVNTLINDMVQPTTEIGHVIEAVAEGDLTENVPLEVEGRPLRGQYLSLASTINTMVNRLRRFADEVTRVAREVGTEGKLGGQADVEGVSGTWRDLTDNVNLMANNLTDQVRNIAEVTTAVAQGDLSKKITIDARGEILELKNIINTMVDQLSSFADEVTRVAREVGTEGQLGGQAEVRGVLGTWRDLTDNVNLMANNLTAQVRNIAEVTTAVAQGDLTKKITIDARGEILELKNTINVMVDQLSSFADEVTRVAREVGTEGQLGGQATVEGVSGTWQDLTDNVNLMASNLTAQVRNIAEVTTAVAQGDLTKKITIDARGEILELKDTINVMVDQLSSFADEVTRVAREVGVEGQLGGQAKVVGVSGTWQDLTDNVNLMASNLTDQVRNIAEVTTAVAQGDLTRKITVEAQGEILELRNTINTMVDQLSSFADEVTRVAREVGTEGQLGGQATVEGVSGTWRDLTDNVNLMANNLTDQVRNIAEVTTAVAQGDLTRKITVEAQGEILELRNIINTMVDQLSSFADEVTRVAREVGVEGQLGGQARVEGVSGTWQDLTDNVNLMASNLTDQVRNIAEVTTAVAQGDLTRKITVEAQGEILELRNTINVMVDQLSSFAAEVTRVAREVGTEGQLGGQAAVEGVSGTWQDLTDNVNLMASNLTDQVRAIAEVTTAVAQGDLTKKITVEAQGEILELRNIINTMVDQLSSFAAEVTRVAREVGTEGQLGGQAAVEGVSGTWQDLTDNVNLMASNLTDQVRAIAEVTTAVAQGDLSRKITVEARGEILELRNIINTMVDQLSSFAAEVTRVAREVGVEGQLGGQAKVEGVSGTWRDLTDNVNLMASNLTDQVRNIAEVTTAVAQGDLTRKITVEARGEILELRNIINTMVDQLSSFAAEVTRVAREVGTEGKLGGQARVEDVSGTWQDLTDNVNQMASNLTEQVRAIAEVTTAVAQGDLTRKITVEARGEILELRNIINTMVDQLSSFAAEVTRVAREVGTEGQLGGQARVEGVSGTWQDLTDNVNQMARNLTEQVRAVAEVTTAVAQGDLTRKITVEARGEILELRNTINTMVDQLSGFADEVTRVAREVGTEGQLGGQADVRGVSGTWRDLTDNVNTMGRNLTDQVRGIAEVVTAVANGNLRKKLALVARGEIAALADTINEMIDTLALFADQVTNVASEVGIEGRLGGQARVPGAEGIWRDLTDNVNELAANLTTQVRAIGEVATAVAEGDLTRTVTVEARGEVAELKDNVNRMIANLQETTRINTEQDWLNTNLARFSRMLQGQRDLDTVASMVLSELAPVINAQHGVFYTMDAEGDEPQLNLIGAYAFKDRKHLANRFRLGEGLLGQAVLEKKRILLTQAPGDYVQITSALGEAPPLNIVVLPILFEQQVLAAMELASFNRFSQAHMDFLEQLAESMGIVLNTISATMRTEELLQESQTMAEELQSRQEELEQTNVELETQTQQLEQQKQEVEGKNREVELARRDLEEKAEQLALTSRYKSEFLTNMSHELRTPLNSVLILSQLMAGNEEDNLTEKQVQFAETINASGAQLLGLINDVLDLSKIEAGVTTLELGEVSLADLVSSLERSFHQVAREKGLGFTAQVDQSLPQAVYTDEKRLQQILRNLLSNAFKFTEEGGVTLAVEMAQEGWSRDHKALNEADFVAAFSVSDTGIGIPKDKQRVIFEAFQQVDGATSRKYGGAGLGLAISREIANLLNGELRLTASAPGEGSTFAFYLPQSYERAPAPPTPGGDPSTTLRTGMGRRGDREIGRWGDREAGLVTAPGVAEERVDLSLLVAGEVADDRNDIQTGDAVLLIIEDDASFAQVLLDMARQRGFKGLVTEHGEVGLALARKFQPDAITLDIQLPTMSGWTVLDRFKHDPDIRHIPVHVISVEGERLRALKQGAIGVLDKPVTPEELKQAFDALMEFRQRAKSLLVVEDDEVQRNSVVELLGGEDVSITAVGTAKEALAAVQERAFDCMVLDLRLPDMNGFTLLNRMNKAGLPDIPVIVYTGKELTKREETRLRKMAQTIIVKGARSPERLLDETALFLHRVEAQLPEPKRQLLQKAQRVDPELTGKKVLIVDDDVRNLFAITSLLEQQGIQVLYAEAGQEGIDLLQQNPDTDLVLMDIMMPEMDGYETTRRIRRDEPFASLPIIALTAKAMKGDREKCIQAGASDYIAKPVDNEQLLSLLRVWLYQ